jgi:hypothetical protein
LQGENARERMSIGSIGMENLPPEVAQHVKPFAALVVVGLGTATLSIHWVLGFIF